MGEQRVMHVSLLGRFSIQHQMDGHAYHLSEQDSTSRRLWSFLQYLAVFHQKAVSQDELIEIVWGDGEISNPVNTLKTLLHRARTLLETLGFPDGKEILLYRRGFYAWGDQVKLVLDIEQFDLLCDEAVISDACAFQINKAKRALEYYAGDLLPNASGSPWAVSLRTFYHAKYLRLAAKTALFLMEQGQYEQASSICRNATTIDPYDETCHLLLMRTLATSGFELAAIQHYTYVSDLFMNHLGVNPSEEMSEFYQQLSKSTGSMEFDLTAVRSSLLEMQLSEGAFFCGYAVFQHIYQLYARDAARSGKVVQLAMISLMDKQHGCLEKRVCDAAMIALRKSIQSTLRVGDVVAQFSPAQYLMLLPTASHENGNLALQRILYTFRKYRIGRSVLASHSLLPVLPTAKPPACG